MREIRLAKFVITSFLCLIGLCATASSEPLNIPKRIIALSPHTVEFLFLLGAGDRIIATTSFADYPEAAKSIPVIGGNNGIQIEKVLVLKPDLIIAWEGGNRADDIAQLERLGFTVYRSQTHDLSGIADELLHLGELLGLQERAKIEAEKFNLVLEKLKTNYADKEKLSLFYQLSSEPLRAVAAKSWINEMLEGCGGENIIDTSFSGYPIVSIETVLNHQPDVIIIPSQHGQIVGTGDFWNKWPEIPAVKNKHIFYVDSDLLHRFSVRALQGMQIICEHLEEVRASVNNP